MSFVNMKYFRLIIFFYLTFVDRVTSLKLPIYIKACRLNDPKLNECVVRNGRMAIPKFINGDTKYRVPRLDPLEISELKLSELSGLKLALRNCSIHGLSQTQFVQARVNSSRKHIEWDFFHPQITIIGNYEVNGRILILPIRGFGLANFTMKNAKTTYKFDYSLIVKDDGEEYMKLKTSTLDAEVDNGFFKLSNLFNGDKRLGAAMNKFLNQNSRDVINELGKPVIESMAEVFNIIFSRITELVPFKLIYS